MRLFVPVLVLVLSACQPATFLDWAALKNPILQAPDRCIKNQTVVRHEGRFWVFAFQRFEDGAAGKRAAVWSTADLREWEPLEPTNLEALSTSDVVEGLDGGWHLVTQGPSQASPASHRLLHGTSPDLRTWSALGELAPANEPAQRQIDGTVANHAGFWWLGYKGDQSFYVTRSEGPELDGRWLPPLRASADGEWAEAFHFTKLDGAWHLVATGRDPKGWRCLNPYVCSHQPFIYRMNGDGSSLEHWASWVDRRQLHVPREDWNRSMHANGASLNDWRAEDGWYYLFYAGSNDEDSFAGRSHCKLGVVRSKDLVTWRVPGDMSE